MRSGSKPPCGIRGGWSPPWVPLAIVDNMPDPRADLSAEDGDRGVVDPEPQCEHVQFLGGPANSRDVGCVFVQREALMRAEFLAFDAQARPKLEEHAELEARAMNDVNTIRDREKET